MRDIRPKSVLEARTCGRDRPFDTVTFSGERYLKEQNPYTPPQSAVADRTNPDGDPWQLLEPRRVSAGRGWIWIKEGFRLFARSPGVWIAIALLFGIIQMALSTLPLVSIAASLIAPILVGGLMLGCRSLEEGGQLEIGHLFAGFNANGGKLAGVGGLSLAASFLVMLVVFPIVFAGAIMPELANLQAGGGPPSVMAVSMILIAVLIGLLLFFTLAMAFWYAPVLVVMHDVDVFDALRMSFKANLRNVWPFTIYGLVLLGLTLLAVLPLLLGLLVIVPLTWTSMYASYKDVFLAGARAS